MQLHYQLLNFDYVKGRRVIEHLRSVGLVHHLRRVIVGDLSCTFRNQHTMAVLDHDEGYAGFRSWCRGQGLRLLYQLPLVVKESEFKEMEAFINPRFEVYDGFVTGDLGMVRYLHRMAEEQGVQKDLIYTSNVLNERFGAFLTERFAITAIRPLMHKRTFIEAHSGLPKDVVVYGNMMINSAIFCFHCGDLPVHCDYSCAEPKQLIMESELMHMVGRALVTENRLDLMDRVPQMGEVSSVTIMDLDLSNEEIERCVRTVFSAGT